MVSSLGLFCFVGIYLAHDGFAEIASVAVTLASATSIAGRNYGSPRMVMIFIMTDDMADLARFLLRGDPYHVVLGLAFGPFMFAIKRFADIVREVLFVALSEQKKANRLAKGSTARSTPCLMAWSCSVRTAVSWWPTPKPRTCCRSLRPTRCSAAPSTAC